MRLPPEILSKIFLIAQAEDVELCRRSGAIPMGSPGATPFDYSIQWVELTHVCHYWREVALNCPSLWTNISTTALVPDEIGDDEYLYTLDHSFVKACLERSQPLLLTIQVHVMEADEGWAMGETCEALIAHGSRFKAVYAFANTYAHIGEEFFSTYAPRLDTLVVDAWDFYS